MVYKYVQCLYHTWFVVMIYIQFYTATNSFCVEKLETSTFPQFNFSKVVTCHVISSIMQRLIEEGLVHGTVWVKNRLIHSQMIFDNMVLGNHTSKVFCYWINCFDKVIFSEEKEGNISLIYFHLMDMQFQVMNISINPK